MNNACEIFIIEDDNSIREGMREILEMEGYSVCTASHGRHAIELLKSGPFMPQLILLDLNMPIMSGQEFLEYLRTENGPTAAIPVILMTALPNERVEGMSDILKKPFNIETLVQKVKYKLDSPSL